MIQISQYLKPKNLILRTEEQEFWESYDLSNSQLDLCCLNRALHNGAKNLAMIFSEIKSDDFEILQSERELSINPMLERIDMSYSHIPDQYLTFIISNSNSLQNISLEGNLLSKKIFI